MADFSVPSWLENIAKPIDANRTGALIGTLAAGAKNSISNDTSFSEGYQGAKMQQRDPMWRMKQTALQLQMAQVASHIATVEVSNRVKLKAIDDETRDGLVLTKLVTDAGTDENKILDSLSQTPLFSARGVQSANQIRLAATQGLKRKSDDKAVSSFFQRANKLPPESYSRVMAIPRDENSGLPTPEAYTLLGTEESKIVQKPFSTLGKLLVDREEAQAKGDADSVAAFDAQINHIQDDKTYAPTKEEKLLKAYRDALDSGDTDAANYYQSRMTTADDRFKAMQGQFLERRLLSKDAEAAGLEASVKELEANPKSKSSFLEEGKQLIQRKAKLADAKAQLEVLRRHKESLSNKAEPVTKQPETQSDPLKLF